MRQDEFKAWFEGYSEGMGDNPPNAKQWDRIKEMVAKIDGTPLMQYIYSPPWRPYWYNHHQPYYGGVCYNPAVGVSSGETTVMTQAYNTVDDFLTEKYAGEHIDTVSATNILKNLGMEDFKHD